MSKDDGKEGAVKFKPSAEMAGGERCVEGLEVVTRLVTGEIFLVDASGAKERNRIPTACAVDDCGHLAVDFFTVNRWPGLNGVAIVPVCASHSKTAYASVFGEAEREVAR